MIVSVLRTLAAGNGRNACYNSVVFSQTPSRSQMPQPSNFHLFRGGYPSSAAAPEMISISSVVIAAWRVRL
jgi:hypothetical protein